MKINLFNQKLASRESEDITEALSLLGSLLVERDKGFIENLTALISTPNLIEDTNTFASILVELNEHCFIQPLIESISICVPGESTHLADYLYALLVLLEEAEEYESLPDEFINLIGGWLVLNNGEISWKCADVLKETDNPAAIPFMVKGIENKNSFVAQRISCLKGVVNHGGIKYLPLLNTLLENEENNEFSEALAYGIGLLRESATT